MYSGYEYWNKLAKLEVGQPKNDRSGMTWQGDIYLISMYDRALNASEILINYQAGLPNNKPVIIPKLQTINTIQNKYNQLNLTFAASDYDNDNVTIYIDMLPNKGTLHILNNINGNITDAITTTQLPFFISNTTTAASTLIYKPPNNQIGNAYTNFSFVVKQTNIPLLYTAQRICVCSHYH
jgi:hypothetical protein